MALWNVRSISGYLKLHFVQQTLEDKNTDIACITETWLNPYEGHKHILSELNKFGYNVSFRSRKARKGGGVAFLIKKHIKFSRVFKNTLQYNSFEWNGIRVYSPKTTYCILCIYRKQEISFLQFHADLSELLRVMFSDSSDEILIVGDFNVHFETVDKPSRDLADLCAEYGLSQQVFEPTRISNHTLDLVFCNPCTLSVNTSVHPDLIDTDNDNIKFDHYPVIFNIPNISLICETPPSTSSTFSKRNIRDMNLDAFRSDFQSKLNERFNQSDIFSEKLAIYNECLSSTLDCYAPLQQFTKYESSHTSNPDWFDTEYINERRLRRKYERQRNMYNTEEAREIYKKQRDRCILLANEKQVKHYSTLIASTENQHGLFRTVAKLWSTPKNNILPGGFDSSSDLANSFNTFFLSKINSIREELISSSSNTVDDGHTPFANHFHSFELLTIDELREVLQEMTIKTSFDDPIPAPVLKLVIESLLPYLLELVNLSLETGDISGLKESVIIPLLKKLNLDSEQFRNYRPIVNLQFLSKLIEKVVLKQLLTHMKSNHLECPDQFAYKKNHSTETILLQVVDEVLIGFDEGSCTILVLLDMSAAFDTVDVKKLLEILENKFGLKGIVLKWFQSFLTKRTQKVLVNGELSEILVTLYGVPQGSVLGPVLFNIYVSFLPSAINCLGFKSSMYADDTNARIKFSLKFQYFNTTVKIPSLLEKVHSWMRDYFLKLNPSKTEIILFTPPSEKSSDTIQGVFIDGNCVRFSKTVELLGVTFDSCLNFDKHVNQLVSQCFYHLKNISKIRRYLSDSDAQKLVHAFVSSKLDYCNAILSGIKQTTVKKLQRVQNYAVKLACSPSQRKKNVDDILHELHWLNIKERILFKVMLLTHKYFIGHAASYFCDLLLVKDNDERSLYVKFVNTAAGKRSFAYTAPRLWNRLPKHIRILNDTERFKRSLKTVLFSNTNNILHAIDLYTR